MLKTKIKAGSVSSLSDARFFSGMGVDWLGFDVNPDSESFVSVELYKSLVGWVSGPKRVIEIPKQLSSESIKKLIDEYHPEYLEVDLNEIGLYDYNLPILARANLPDVNLKMISGKIDYLVLNGDVDVLQEKELLTEITRQTKILLSISPNVSGIDEILEKLPVSGFALKGSRELQPGIKEYDYSELLESLEIE